MGYLETILTIQNYSCIVRVIKRSLDTVSVCYHPVCSLSFSSFQFKNTNINTNTELPATALAVASWSVWSGRADHSSTGVLRSVGCLSEIFDNEESWSTRGSWALHKNAYRIKFCLFYMGVWVFSNVYGGKEGDSTSIVL
jgi:hypothetical protein